MSDLERQVSAVRRRLKLFRVLDWCLWGLVIGLAATALFQLVLKFVDHDLPVWEISGAIVGGCLLAAIIAALAQKLTLYQAAIQADERLNLRERISSALLLGHSERRAAPAYSALEEDARNFAKAIRPGRDFTYQLPRHARHTLWPALAIVGIYFMPSFNLFEKPPAPPVNMMVTTQPTMTPEQRKEQSERLKELAEHAREDNLEAADGDLELADKLERLSRDLSLGKKSEREMVAEMSRMSDELKMRERQIMKQAEPFKQMKGLERAEYTQELQKDLKNQDFDSAADKMMKMADMMQDPSKMSADQAQKMADELKEMSESLKDNPAMSDALQQASEAMQQMAEQKKQDEEQKQDQANSGDKNQSKQGGEQEKSNQGNSQQNQGQKQQQQANQQGSQSSSPGQQGQQKQQQAAQSAAAAMKNAASQMKDMQQMMSQAQCMSEMQSSMSSAMSQSLANTAGQKQGSQQSGSKSGQTQGNPSQPGACKECNGAGCKACNGTGLSKFAGTGQFKQGNSQAQGMGSGGPGRGRGGNPPDDGSMASAFDDVFVPGIQNDGEIIATYEIEASAPRGESSLRYTSVPQAYKQRAADAISNQEIPAGMRNAVKDYFEAINFQTGDGTQTQTQQSQPQQ